MKIFNSNGKWEQDFLLSKRFADFQEACSKAFENFDGDIRHLSHALMNEVIRTEVRTQIIKNRNIE